MKLSGSLEALIANQLFLLELLPILVHIFRNCVLRSMGCNLASMKSMVKLPLSSIKAAFLFVGADFMENLGELNGCVKKRRGP